jgi:hypothetical protein
MYNDIKGLRLYQLKRKQLSSQLLELMNRLEALKFAEIKFTSALEFEISNKKGYRQVLVPVIWNDEPLLRLLVPIVSRRQADTIIGLFKQYTTELFDFELRYML